MGKGVGKGRGGRGLACRGWRCRGFGFGVWGFRVLGFRLRVRVLGFFLSFGFLMFSGFRFLLGFFGF